MSYASVFFHYRSEASVTYASPGIQENEYELAPGILTDDASHEEKVYILN